METRHFETQDKYTAMTSSSANAVIGMKKRIHDDNDDIIPVTTTDPKKMCRLATKNSGDGHDDNDEKRADVRNQNYHHDPPSPYTTTSSSVIMDDNPGMLSLVQRLQSTKSSSTSILDIIAESGSIDVILRLFHYLFSTCRVESFALDLFLQFYKYFPEEARYHLCLFQHYSCWRQLLHLMYLGKRNKKFGNQLVESALEVMKEQWKMDLQALGNMMVRSKNTTDNNNNNNNNQKMDARNDNNNDNNSSNGHPPPPPSLWISDMALWLPQEGRKLDRKLGFTRMFTKVLYPADKLSVARSKYRKQVTKLRDILVQPSSSCGVSGGIPQLVKPLSSSLPAVQQPFVVMTNGPTTTAAATTTTTTIPGTFNAASRKQQTTPEDQELFPTQLQIPTGDDEQEKTIRLFFPVNESIDEYLMKHPSVARTRDKILNKTKPRHFTRESTERVLYINQGELGHALPTQCDVMVSDRATTCHILAIRSTSSSDNNLPLTSLAHIDSDSYDECIVSMIEKHINHHHHSSSGSASVSNDQVPLQNKPREEKKKCCDIQIHIVGGFDDDRGSSTRISAWLLDILAWLSETHKDAAEMTLQTCLISRMNDNGHACPIGRGMGIDLRTGEAFLAKADLDVAGPASQLRSARIWVHGGGGRLSVVHDSTCNEFRIHPFDFGVFPRLNQYLRLPNRKMIRRTSTSPDVEEPDFCLNVRNTLRFMREIDSSAVFGHNVDQPLTFHRIVNSNEWSRWRRFSL